jgi:hypothetical protein
LAAPGLLKDKPAGMICSMSLVEYIKYCCTGEFPASVATVRRKSAFLDDIVCLADLLGALEPLCASRPGVCDVRAVVDRDIAVGPATLNANGSVTPSEARATSICAPMNRALVVEVLRVTPANLTAADSGQAEFKRVNLGTFGENWCLAFEPQDTPGQFANVEHIVTPPGAGFTLHAKNFDPFSEAVFHLHAEMWACC